VVEPPVVVEVVDGDVVVDGPAVVAPRVVDGDEIVAPSVLDVAAVVVGAGVPVVAVGGSGGGTWFEVDGDIELEEVGASSVDTRPSSLRPIR
jgi:hypothetical protein